MVSELGCGAFGAAIVARESPSTILRDITRDVIAASCNRRLNVVSDAKLTIGRCPVGSEIIPWKHALLLSWDADFLWYGPITNITDGSDGNGEIEAKDLMAWMSHRKVRTDYSSIGTPTDVATTWASIVNAGFAQDPSVAYALTPILTGILAEREVLASDQVYVADAVQELSVTGIDWTVILQQIVCGNVDILTAPIGVLNERHFVTKPSVSLQGEDQANFVTVAGDATVAGFAQDLASEAVFGLLDLIERESSILDLTSAYAAAETRLDLRVGSPITLSQLVLRDISPLALSDLVPGAIVTVSIDGSFVSYAGDVRMDSAEFNVVQGRWQATINAQPVGTT